MDASEVTEVCRLCPSSGGGEDLLYVFDERLSVKNNMKEVILVTTGIQIQENDIISKKICHRCCTKTLQMFLFRQDALTQDRALKEKCSRFLEDKGIRLPNTCITIKRERRDSFVPLKRPKVEFEDVPLTTNKPKPKKSLHPSVADIFKTYTHIKLPKKCLDRHLAPVVSFTMGEVEKYYKQRKIDMRKFIYKPSNINKKPSNAVAKKRTSFPTKQKTVSPIKISKKLIESHEVQRVRTNIDYVCTSVHKDKQSKKSISSLDCNQQLPSKKSHESKVAESQSLTKLVETPKPSFKQLAETQTSVVEPVIQISQTLPPPRMITPAPIDPVSKNSKGSYSSSTTKPEFIESLGLTPRVTATKSQTLHVCNLCGSVHNNAFKLKTHTRKHMVCQFCKKRFKSLETKQDHVDNSCQVKVIMNSSEPFVELEKIHLNLDIRKKYKDAFSTFEAIPGLEEPDNTEKVIVKAASPLSYLDTNDVVLLSDDEEVPTKSNDLPSDVTMTSSNMTTPATENVTYSTVSIVRPDVRIKNDTIMDSIAGNVTDGQAIKDLIVHLKLKRPKTVEKMLQTDLPANKDIKINNAEGFCEFKYLKEQLLSYRIPVSITDGPFHVAYQYKNNSNSTKTMELWDDLPVLNVYDKTPPNQSGNKSIPLLPTYFPTDKITNGNFQIQLTHNMASSVMPIITTNMSGLATMQNNSFSVSAPVTNFIVNANIANSATPLLQNFAQSTIPAQSVNKPIPIPKTYVNSALTYNASTSKRSITSLAKNTSSRQASLSRKSLPANDLKVGKTVATRNRSSYSASLTDLSPSLSATSITSSVEVQVVNSAAFSSTTDSSSTSLAAEMSRFRVKNVWELQ